LAACFILFVFRQLTLQFASLPPLACLFLLAACLFACFFQFFTIESMDGYLDTEPPPINPVCPQCNQAVKGPLRYGAVLKERELSAVQFKFEHSASAALARISKEVSIIRAAPPAAIDTAGPAAALKKKRKQEQQEKKKFNKVLADIDALLETLTHPPKEKAHQARISFGTISSALLYADSDSTFAGMACQARIVGAQLCHGEIGNDSERPLLLKARDLCDGAIAMAEKWKLWRKYAEARIMRAKIEFPMIRYLSDGSAEKDALIRTVEEQCRMIRSVLAEHAANMLSGDNGFEVKVKEEVEKQLEECASEKKARKEIFDLFNEGAGWLGHGHWYACENGHPYVIGDCGGAVMVSTCPECGVRIGGANHRAAAGNVGIRSLDGS
jgi:hypothetical protein